MQEKVSVLTIGIHPELANLAPFPGLTVEKLTATLKASADELRAQGYDVEQCFIAPDPSAAAGVVTPLLQSGRYNVVLIGAGVRVPAEHVMLFENLVALWSRHAPQARLCFNTLPSDTVAAVQRAIAA